MLAWREMFRAALAAGLSPTAFWALSLREWRWLARGANEGGLSRAEVVRLAAAIEEDRDDGRDRGRSQGRR